MAFFLDEPDDVQREYKRKQSELVARYPEYLEGIPFGVGVNAGWFGILDDMCRELVALGDPPFRFRQIKEKMGELRLYWHDPNGDEIEATEAQKIIISAAVKRAETTCETCGRPGILRRDTGWIQVMCDERYEATMKARKAERNRHKRLKYNENRKRKRAEKKAAQDDAG